MAASFRSRIVKRSKFIGTSRSSLTVQCAPYTPLRPRSRRLSFLMPINSTIFLFGLLPRPAALLCARTIFGTSARLWLAAASLFFHA
jgi:hypothetical protein